MEAIEIVMPFATLEHIKNGPKVKLSKIAVAPDAEVEAAKWEEHVAGQSNEAHGKSLPIDYWIQGTLINEPKENDIINIFRTNRNGVEATGFFTSSLIKKIDGNKLYTANSVYLLEYLDAPANTPEKTSSDTGK